MDREKAKAELDKWTRFWVGREVHPPDLKDDKVYLFLERPEKLRGPKGQFFWRVSDPSKKILLPACMSPHLKLKPGDLLPVLKSIGG